MGKHCEIKTGKVDSARFFEALWRRFPEATTLYVEGGSIAPDVTDCYRTHQEEGDYLPRAQTIFPRSAKFRCRFSAELADALSALADRHANPSCLTTWRSTGIRKNCWSRTTRLRTRLSCRGQCRRALFRRSRRISALSTAVHGLANNRPLEQPGFAGRSAPGR
jgi:hypothetical protein